jgi:hypothetical protein
LTPPVAVRVRLPGSDVSRAIANVYAGSILVLVLVDDVVNALDAPMTAIDIQQTLSSSPIIHFKLVTKDEIPPPP